MEKKLFIKNSLFCLMLTIWTVSCATSSRYKLETNDSIAKGASGVVAVVPTDSNNTKMRVRVKHLYPAQELQSGATNYIVWVKPEGSGTFQNAGALQVDNMLQAEYATVIPFSSFELLVTPEKGNSVQKPSGPRIFSQRIIR